ncbi:pre-rRNA-processing protein ESF1 [Corchorus olitorius]|uniref:Pre-rRNA-processing protein ESF1 n=1 Tax=Corchorus olitorius TaxID=93759 RepID=A0A1R3H4P8_9ROSI|nr:pre-rRNA-processing protein ESF1 [Corchorus olitorius]
MAFHGGKMKSVSINGVKMYTISSHQRSVAAWLSPKKQRSLRKDKNYMERLELIQDLRFETATSKIKITPDGEFLIASGIYPPQVKVYELRQFSMKFERHLDSEIIDFQVLADDYSKLAFLCADRSINLHAKYGKHYSLRIPRMGRDMAYDCWSCDLLCAASSPDIYRINLEQGRFLSSLNTQSPALNVVSRSKLHGLVACGGEDGAVECFDMRMRSSIGRINAVSPAADGDEEVTAIEFDSNGGFLMGVGSSAGKVLIYDLRSSSPIRVKDHMYGSPILDIKWHSTMNFERPKLITTDSHIVKIWDPETGEAMTSIEPTAGAVNDICVFNDSGLLVLALDSSQIPSYFIPALGPVPKWCSSLESLTEELEEGGQTSIYDNYKFLTKEDLEKLNLTNLIGTNLLRAYMHGFFIDYRLYKKAKALADPFAYETYIEQRKQEKLEAERRNRITIKRKLPKVKVNQDLAERILENEEAENEKIDTDGNETKKTSKKKKGALSTEIFKDDRFAQMFENKDFEIDDQSQEYLALHPMAAKKQPSLVEEHFEPVMENEDQSASDSDVSEASEGSPVNHKSKRQKSQGPRMYEVKDKHHAEAFWNNVSLAKEDSLPMGERVKALQDDQRVSGLPSDVKMGPGGSRQISFITKSSAKYEEDDEDRMPRREKRGVQSLANAMFNVEAKSTTYGGRKTMLKKIDSESIKHALAGYHLSAMKHERRVMEDVKRISPGGPDPIHDNTPPAISP